VSAPVRSSRGRRGIAYTLRSSRTHRERVGCGTPTASANCDALTAYGPTRRFTTRALNAALYSGMATSTPTLLTMTYADARVVRQPS
jgi:hypothetical protein